MNIELEMDFNKLFNDLIIDLEMCQKNYYKYARRLFPERVIFNDPATIVFWDDGSKTVVKCQPGDVFDKEKGLALAYVKRLYNNKGNFNEVFKKWIEVE